ncbi:hypothetical protein [Nocardioides okcheonensis]|uniref:hypothetical protein n=1 Tax=Nocardioides okcheonensis TaxID=2894081 RepID=UPI001E457C12|nr:hypothetical protein [Nocardioides okcheonensis]UFN44513.1 hypothetical protein LN652_21130 [Nocardioides okcheonensis]
MTDRSVLVRVRADVSDLVAKSQLAKAAIHGVNSEIDKSNDRTAWLAQGILALTPAVTRLGAGAVPVLSGIATQLTVGAAAAGTAALAFNGIGDALGALNDYQLEPTEANLAKLNETMQKIGPAGQALVEYLDTLGPAFSRIANSAREGMFPGVIDGIRDFMTLAPELSDVVREIGEGMGQLTAEAGAGLSGDRFADFFEYLETRAKPILVEMGRTVGNITDGLLNILVAFDPLTDDFSRGLLEMSRSFVAWSEGLSTSTGFQEFVAYVREAGPQTLDFLGSFALALVEIAEAAAPVGAAMLPVLTAILDVVGDLADTPLGPLTLGFLSLTAAWGRLNAIVSITGSGVMAKATAGIRENVTSARQAVPTFRQLGNAMVFSLTSTDALTRSMESGSKAARTSATAALNARGQVMAFGRSIGPVAAQVGLLALAASDLDDKMGLTNTTSLALAGSLAGPWGAAVGAGAGLFLDMKDSADQATASLEGLDAAISSGNIEAVAAKLAELRKGLEDSLNPDGFRDGFGDFVTRLSNAGSLRDIINPLEGQTQEYTEQINEAEAALIDLKNARQDAAEGSMLYDSLQAETAALEANIAAMRAKREEVLRALSAELDYKASILDARDALEENGRSVNENTRAGQANLRALYGLAAAWNAQDDATKNAAGSLRTARTNFIETATAMGMGEDKARKLAAALFEIPTERKVAIQVDADLAFQRLRSIKAEIDAIDRNIVVGVSIQRGGGGELPYLAGGIPRSAAGATVPDSGRTYAARFRTLTHTHEGAAA